MVSFYDTYSQPLFISRLQSLGMSDTFMAPAIVSAEMTQLLPTEIVSSSMTQIPALLMRTGWTNHQIILRQCKQDEQRIFYILYSEYERLNNKQLERAIKTDAYSNVLTDKKYQSQLLQATYPEARILLKDKAFLDVLGLPRQYKEPRLRKEIVEHMKDFILEMGKDFLFKGQEYPLMVGGKAFRCDF